MVSRRRSWITARCVQEKTEKGETASQHGRSRKKSRSPLTDDSVPNRRMSLDDPRHRRCRPGAVDGVAKGGSQTSDDDQATRHRDGATEEKRTSSETIDKEDGGDYFEQVMSTQSFESLKKCRLTGERDSKGILNTRCDEIGLPLRVNQASATVDPCGRTLLGKCRQGGPAKTGYSRLAIRQLLQTVK